MKFMFLENIYLLPGCACPAQEAQKEKHAYAGKQNDPGFAFPKMNLMWFVKLIQITPWDTHRVSFHSF